MNNLLNRSFLITGGSGLIGSSLTKHLLKIPGIRIVLPVRDRQKALERFYDQEDLSSLEIIECDLQEWLASYNNECDYIIHCASPTSGDYMSNFPVETFEFSIETTRLLLQYAIRKKVYAMVYISSIEYYGINSNDTVINENFQGYIDDKSRRSSYPLAKRAAEYLCYAYAEEYDVNVKCARLTQTFGPGVSLKDNRVFMQFAKNIINNKNIELHTEGNSAKPYCYISDAVSAILTILLKGKKGESYNVANDKTYISIKDMAFFLRDTFNSNIQVVHNISKNNYAPETRLNLSTEKLKELGWEPKYNLKSMYENLIDSLR